MSDPRPVPPTSQRFTLAATPPVRPLAIAAVAVVLAAAVLVLWRSLDLSVVLAGLAAVLMVLGLALAVAAVALTARLRTQVRLDADALTVVRGGKQRSVPWEQVREVTLQHPRLTVVAAEPDSSVVVVNPRSAGDPIFHALQESIRQRLDHDRGYRSLD